MLTSATLSGWTSGTTSTLSRPPTRATVITTILRSVLRPLNRIFVQQVAHWSFPLELESFWHEESWTQKPITHTDIKVWFMNCKSLVSALGSESCSWCYLSLCCCCHAPLQISSVTACLGIILRSKHFKNEVLIRLNNYGMNVSAVAAYQRCVS